MKISLQSKTLLNNSYAIAMEISLLWRHYWQNNQKASFYQALSDQLINRPYVDKPDYLVRVNDTIIYHPNHDTAHAIRQSCYSSLLLQLVESQGVDNFRLATQALNTEEKEIVLLASFLARAGRTNEYSGRRDPSNQKRSAELLRLIALAVGFNKDLANALSDIMALMHEVIAENKEQQLVLAFTGNDTIKKHKLHLIKQVLYLSHHIDLLRCESDCEKIERMASDSLTVLLAAGAIHKKVKILLNYVRASCDKTGTRYFKEDNSERVTPPIEYKAYAVTHVYDVLQTLQGLGKIFLAALNADNENLESQPMDMDTSDLEQAVVTIQKCFFARRAHAATQQATYVFPPTASKITLRRIINDLKIGDGLSTAEKERKKQAILLEEEQALFNHLMFEFEWTLKHITSNYKFIEADGNVLKSLHQRNREARYNTEVYTSDFEGRSDNIYFTLAGPNGWPAEFLQADKGHEIRIPLRKFIKRDCPGDKLTGLWLSSSWYGFNYQDGRYLKSEIANTKRDIHYVKVNPQNFLLEPQDYKHYSYQREDGTSFERRVSLNEETVSYKELLPFLAYNIILELRLIGGSYRHELLHDQTFANIEPFINVIYEQRNFEALLPSRLYLNDKRIEIKPFNQGEKASIQHVARMRHAVQDGNIQAIKAALNQGISIDIDLGGNTSPLMYCLSIYRSTYIPVIEFLIKEGANTQMCAASKSLVCLAIMNHYPLKIVDMLLNNTVLEKKDRRIKRYADVNIFLDAVLAAIFLHKNEVLTLFKRYGFNFEKNLFPICDRIFLQPEIRAIDLIQHLEGLGVNFSLLASQEDNNVYNLLALLIEKNYSLLLEKCLRLGCNPQVKSLEKELSLLELAKNHGNLKAVELLEKQSAPLTVVQSKKRTFNHLIVENTQNQLLIAKKRRVDSSVSSSFQFIAGLTKNNAPDSLNELLFLATGIRSQESSTKVLASVVNNDTHESVILVQIKDKELQPVQTGEWAMCQWLDRANDTLPTNALVRYYQKGGNNFQVMLNNCVLLEEAIKHNDLNKVKIILQQGVIDDKGIALFKACDTANPNLTIIQLLLDYGYDVNSVFAFEGQEVLTPLLLAITHHQLGLIAWLLDKGAAGNQAVNDFKVTPLMHAAALDQFDTLELLLARGCCFNHPANQAILAYVCIRECSDKMFNYLLEQVDINQTFLDFTPLLITLDKNQPHRAEQLVAKGADVNCIHPGKLKTAISLLYHHDFIYRYYPHYAIESEDNLLNDYFKLTGKLDSPDFYARLAEEFNLTIISDHPVLKAFSQQLLSDAGYDDNYSFTVKLAIAHSGDNPVFTCHGFNEPVIALHKAFLLAEKTDYKQLCFAVAHELNYIHEKVYQFRAASLAERIDYDRKAIKVCPYENLLINFLQDAGQFFKQYADFDNFKWPRELYNHNEYNNFCFEHRIKTMHLLIEEQKLATCTAHQSLADEVKQAVQELTLKSYFDASLFANKSPAEQYDYLISKLPLLADEFLPFAKTNILSLRAREFSRLLSQLPDLEEKQNELLQHAMDLNLPCFDFIYKKICKVNPYLNYDSDPETKLKPMVCFYEMKIALENFINAKHLSEALRAHQEIMRLYPQITGRSPELTTPNKSPIKSALREIYQRIEWPKLNDYEQHLDWADTVKGNSYQLWKSLWILGITNDPRLYRLMPRAILVCLLKKSRYANIHSIPTPLNNSIELYQIHPIIHAYLNANAVAVEKSERFKSLELIGFIKEHEASFTVIMNKEIHEAVIKLLTQSSPATIRHFFLSDEPYCLKDLSEKELIRPYHGHHYYLPWVRKNRQLFSAVELFTIFARIFENFSLDTAGVIEVFGLDDAQVAKQIFCEMYKIYLSKSCLPFALFISITSAYLTIINRSVISQDFYNLLKFSRDINLLSLFWSEAKSKVIFDLPEGCLLTVSETAELYLYLNDIFGFPDVNYRTRLEKVLLAKIAHLPNGKIQIDLIEKLLFSNCYLHSRDFFNNLVKKWISFIEKNYGKDNGSRLYAYKMQPILNRVYNDCFLNDAISIFDKLTIALEAQNHVCIYIEHLVAPEKDNYTLRNKITVLGVLQELLQIVSNQDKKQVLDFLSSPLSANSLKIMSIFISQHEKLKSALNNLAQLDKNNNNFDFILSIMYQNFWDLKLKERIILIDSIIIGVSDETSEERHQQAYQEGFNYITQKLFPNAANNERESFALALLTSYLQVARKHERQFLLAALLVTTNACAENDVSLGRKLTALCEHLGPAYVKLAQAIHSHPDTPTDIKEDLSHLKGRANPPYRWEIWRLIKKVLPVNEFNNITHLGALLGSASYNLALEITTSKQEKQVLLLVRDNAKEDAEKGFNHLYDTVQACPHPFIQNAKNTFSHIITEAQNMSQSELSTEVGNKQHQLAQGLYQDVKKFVCVDDTYYFVLFTAAQNLKSGFGYRYLTQMPGVEFNDLPKNTLQDKKIRRAVALAVMEQELSLILSGRQFDCDRHGNQMRILVEGNRIKLGLYDFGEMSLEPLSDEELQSLANLLREFPAKRHSNQLVNALFETHIQRLLREGKSARHLMRVNKALLALQDFQQCLNDKEKQEIFYKIKDVIHPILAQAFIEGFYQSSSNFTKALLFFGQKAEGATQFFTGTWEAVKRTMHF